MGPSTSDRRAGRLAYAAVLVFIAIKCAALVETAAMVDLADYGEGPMTAFVARWATQPVDDSWTGALPFTAIPYGPLLPLAWRLAAAVAPGVGLLMVGRAVTLLAALLLGMLVWYGARGTERSNGAGWLAVAVLVASPVASGWLPTARVDVVAAVAAAAAYLLAFRNTEHALAPALALAVASLGKQTALIHVVPLAWMYWRRVGPQRATSFVALTGVATAAVWLGVSVVWGSELLRMATSTLNGRVLYAAEYRSVVAWLIAPSSLLALGVAWARISTAPRAAAADPWIAGYVWALLFGCATRLFEGAGLGYFLDAAWLGAIVVGRSWADALVAFPRLVHGAVIGALLIYLPTAVLERYPSGRLQPPSAHRAQRVAEVAAGHPYVLADGNLVGELPAGTRPLVNDPFLFRLLDDRHRAPTQALLERLNDPDLVLLLSVPLPVHQQVLRHWPRAVLDRMTRDYCLTDWSESVAVYRHRNATTSCRPDPEP